jgi:hypothetical protein
MEFKKEEMTDLQYNKTKIEFLIPFSKTNGMSLSSQGQEQAGVVLSAYKDSIKRM